MFLESCSAFLWRFQSLETDIPENVLLCISWEYQPALAAQAIFIHNQKHLLIVMYVFKSFQNNWVGALLLKHVAGLARL